MAVRLPYVAWGRESLPGSQVFPANGFSTYDAIETRCTKQNAAYQPKLAEITRNQVGILSSLESEPRTKAQSHFRRELAVWADIP